MALPNMIRVAGDADVAYIMRPDLCFALLATLVARLRRIPAVLIVQDVMPDAAVELGLLRHDGLVALLRHLVRWMYAEASMYIR